jgi:WD40 repeat protein/serine/threonine protein kinase
MAEGRDERVEALFHQAADLPPHEQRALLDAACPDDPGLRAEVERLLADDARLRASAPDFLDSPLVRPLRPSTLCPAPAAGAGPALPPRIGHYRVLRLLGEGGMGAVFEAEQDNPRRPVALKVIRPGLVSPALLKRFTHEAQILGRLHHPGIASIYEAGVTEDGQPFFALELIRGLALDEYARRHGLDPAARLDLLARVCDAVQHAHEQGVIHRDLKPGNILVDETGQPKVLDFGVARATGADLLTSTDHTRTGQLLGTLSYMSPEQVAADPAVLDQRSDVYTLGVILFELLAGRRPYPLEDLALPEAARVIREQEPSRLGSIDTRFRGDVETIVAKALEKDRGRRYQSAAELAADIRRHLRSEPIRARPPSALYQLRKFARRHKALVGGVAGVLAALAVGLVGTILFAVREARQRGEAERNARRANAEAKAALYQTYRARVAAAGAALQNHDVATAARHLEEAPKALRDWEWRHLHSRLDESSAVYQPPVGGSLLLASCSEGLRLASVTPTNVRLLDEAGRECHALFRNPEHWLVSVGESRRGPWSLVADQKRTVYLLDQAGKVRLKVDNTGKGVPRVVAVSQDLTRLAMTWWATELNWFEVYDVASGKQVAAFHGHEKEIYRLVFSPDGSQVASASEDGTARVWDAMTGAATAVLRGHRVKVHHVAFRPDGTRVLTASADGTVRQWDPKTGVPVGPPWERHTHEVRTAEYSPDGQWIASAGVDRTVRVWPAAGGPEVIILHGHTGLVTQLAYSPDGRRLASASADGTVRIWDVAPQAGLPVLRGHTSYVYPVAYSPDGRWIASGDWDGAVRLWDAQTGEACAESRSKGIVRALAFSPDSSWLVFGRDGQDQMQIWDVATGRLRRTIPKPGKVLQGVQVSPDGSRVAAVDRDGGRGTITDFATGREVASFRTGNVFNRKGLAYSPDGRWLAGVGEDRKTVCLWDAQTLQPSALWTGHTADIQSVAFSPDGRRLASAGSDRTVRVWDVATGKCRGGPLMHTDEVFTAVFHPGGTRLASAGRDGMIWLWDLVTGEEVARLTGHTGYVFSLAFSPAGETLVSGSGDGTVRLWDTAPLARRHQARRAAAALRPEAERLLDRLFREKKEASRVAQSLKEDGALGEPLRRAAFHALLRPGRADQ